MDIEDTVCSMDFAIQDLAEREAELMETVVALKRELATQKEMLSVALGFLAKAQADVCQLDAQVRQMFGVTAEPRPHR